MTARIYWLIGAGFAVLCLVLAWQNQPGRACIASAAMFSAWLLAVLHAKPRNDP